MTKPSSQPQAKHTANDGMFCNNILAPSIPVLLLSHFDRDVPARTAGGGDTARRRKACSGAG